MPPPFTYELSTTYDPNGNNYGVLDGIWGKGTYLEFDLAGRVNGVATVDLSTKTTRAYESVRYNDGKGTVESMAHTMFDASGVKLKTISYDYTYGDPSSGEIPDTLYKYEIGLDPDVDVNFTFTYDDLARLQNRTLNIGTVNKAESYTYKANKNNSAYTTTLVESMTDFTGKTHTYTYDKNGNILTDTYDGNTVSYEYDSQNRLVEYHDPVADRSCKFVYDDRGNIIERYDDDYRTEEYLAEYGWNPYVQKTYTYGDSVWADLMTSYGGTSITYDELGNPLNWHGGRGVTLTWENGRQLAQVNKSNTVVIDYTYNADGLRTSKTVTNKRTSAVTKSSEYYIVNGQYIGEVTTVGGTEYVLGYFYDENGAPAGIWKDGAVYYFAKNLQGDVVAILDYQGNVVAKYTYDAWGDLLSITDATGANITSDTDIGKLNPFRYRGYMYDEETGFYYLRSRYYDPEVGRFLNSDGLVTTGQGFDGNNMFAYCNNNPVMFVDYTGHCSESPDLIAEAYTGTLEHIKGCCAGTIICTSGYKHNALERWVNISIESFLTKSSKNQNDATMAEKERFIDLIYLRAKINEPRTGIPAELLTAQACLESAYGTSVYAKNRKNLFGFLNQTFNSYNESILAYESLLTTNSRYNIFIGKTLDEWIDGIGPAGYCPESDYASKIRSVISYWDIGG